MREGSNGEAQYLFLELLDWSLCRKNDNDLGTLQGERDRLNMPLSSPGKIALEALNREIDDCSAVITTAKICQVYYILRQL